MNLDQLWQQLHPGQGDRPVGWHGENGSGSGEDPNVNKYYDQLLQQYGNNRDLALKKLDAEHKLAVGNNDASTAQFLESVANKYETEHGQIPYDYQRYSNKELTDYANGNQAITENKQNALDKLSADEASTNRGAVDSLNSRGLMYGQQPTGGTDMNQSGYNPLTGLNGAAGYNAEQTNKPYQLQGQGIQNDFGQQQRGLDTSHNFNMEDITTNARRGVIGAQNTFNFGTQGENNLYDAMKNQVNSSRQSAQVNQAVNNAQAQGRKQQIYGY